MANNNKKNNGKNHHKDIKDFKGDRNRYITLFEAAQYTPYSQEYLSLRARQSKLKAAKIGYDWVTTINWVNDYLKKINNNKNGKEQKISFALPSKSFVKYSALTLLFICLSIYLGVHWQEWQPEIKNNILTWGSSAKQNLINLSETFQSDYKHKIKNFNYQLSKINRGLENSYQVFKSDFQDGSLGIKSGARELGSLIIGSFSDGVNGVNSFSKIVKQETTDLVLRQKKNFLSLSSYAKRGLEKVRGLYFEGVEKTILRARQLTFYISDKINSLTQQTKDLSDSAIKQIAVFNKKIVQQISASVPPPREIYSFFNKTSFSIGKDMVYVSDKFFKPAERLVGSAQDGIKISKRTISHYLTGAISLAKESTSFARGVKDQLIILKESISKNLLAFHPVKSLKGGISPLAKLFNGVNNFIKKGLEKAVFDIGQVLVYINDNVFQQPSEKLSQSVSSTVKVTNQKIHYSFTLAQNNIQSLDEDFKKIIRQGLVIAKSGVLNTFKTSRNFIGEQVFVFETSIDKNLSAAQIIVLQNFKKAGSFINKNWLATRSFISEGGLAINHFASERWFASRHFVLQRFSDTGTFISESWLAVRDSVGKGWLAFNNSLSNGWSSTQKFVLNGWLAVRSSISEGRAKFSDKLSDGYLALLDYLIPERSLPPSPSVAPEKIVKKPETGIVVIPSIGGGGISSNKYLLSKIEEAFSDEVKIQPTKDGKAGVIKPVSPAVPGEEYLYMLVPINQ